MKFFKYVFIVMFIIASCKRQSDDERFSSHLGDIVEDMECQMEDDDRIVEKVLKLVTDNPESLNYSLWNWETEEYMYQRRIKIATSDDGNVRVYSIDNVVPSENRSFGPNGTWIIQYRVEGIVYVSVWEGKRSFVRDVFSIKGLDTTYYLFVDHSSYIRQGEFLDETITAYSINPYTNKFQEEKLFKTTKKLLSSIDISWIDCDYTVENPVYSEQHHIYCYEDEMYIPLITNRGIMTEGYLLYSWNGKVFEYKGIDVIAEFKANEFTIRIEVLPNGSYKYSSWGNNKSTQQSPDLILYNGKLECWGETGRCDCNAVYENGVSSLLGREYTFKNNEYSYRFEYGWWKGHFREYFTIFKGEEEIFSTKVKIIRI